ncbi:MAG: HAMP domain-containing protein [Deltaproteobacteria bacterium]|nr:HAMP domain-containing protein [Deltaproteobacteria bacterium]
MMKFNLGIRAQLTAGIVLTTLAGIGLIGLLSIKIVENSAVYWKISEAGKILRIIRSSMQKSSQGAYSPESIRFAEEALRSAGVSDYVVTVPAGKAVLREGTLPDDPGEEVPYQDLSVRRIGGGWFQGPGRLLLVSSSFDGAGDGGGSIRFTVSLSDIRADMAGVRKFLLFYALLDSAIIILLGVYFLSRSITGPLKKLEEAATRIAGGKLGERADVSVDNEVGSLAASFNVMAERLEAEIKSLERVNLELVGAQEELLRSGTLAAVGRLAAGIAHEIGNPLGAVHGYLDILSKGLPDREEEKDIIGRVSKEVSRIDSIVREFLDIARPPKKPSAPVDVNRLIGETVSALALHRDFSGVGTKLDLAGGLPEVAIDGGKLRQVFVNLLLNAAQSMSAVHSERTVSITTSTERRSEGVRLGRRRDDPPVKGRVPVDREFVVIRFTDSGSGISVEDAEKIFDPFFTTKDVGKGTGLGLFISQSIIKTYGGGISFERGDGTGSTFTVILPSGR